MVFALCSKRMNSATPVELVVTGFNCTIFRLLPRGPKTHEAESQLDLLIWELGEGQVLEGRSLASAAKKPE